ncbi:MAG TPA: hypothetical protein VG714_04065 [Acidobacteriaceae bacterium]|nr:hypothetical protein [Acidobacteriaceae bacterium]
MATEALPLSPVSRTRPANPRSDRLFFGIMVLTLWATVLYGFSKTYYAAGMIEAPLPNRLIHVHAILMTLWMLLLFVQVGLVLARKVAWHRSLGVFGFLVALSMVIIGPMAATDALRRGEAPLGLDALTFYIIPLTAIGLFAVFAFAAWRARRQPAAHKRLILIANISLMDAAVGRWPVPFLQAHPPAQDLIPFGFLLAIVIYDVISQRKVLRSTIWASLLLIAVHLTRVPIGKSAAWHAFATFMLGH